MFDDVHFSIMLATLVIFLALMIILNSLLYKPLLKFIDERNSSINSDEERVRQNVAEMSGFNEEFEKIKQSTRDEIAKIKQKALDEARNMAEEEIKAKRVELEQKMEIFSTELSKQRIELEQELKLRLPLWQEALRNNLKNI
ncbi:F0F1 ATP synthase subunit B' [Campylobacter troglodytis]|uniref:F0F1 ATP synthase subunit B family protein n=1 Tax=Campylobacter troglodytis TaxID=654363 RepID=UPI00115BE897|nr:F0F1 ATP synthase subunit B' [Campylobacter troglodytis]TQR61387.1 F0F1 ATP synthase subunit B' [Campylobacter troglodytis]